MKILLINKFLHPNGGSETYIFKLGEYLPNGSVEFARTMAFITLALSQVIQAFNMRSDKSIFKIGPFSNKKLNLSVLASVLLVVFVLFVPGVQTAFGLTYLPWQFYLISFGLSIVPLFVMEIAKLIGCLIKKRKNK